MSDGIKTAKIVEDLLGVPVAADEAILLEQMLFRQLSDQVKALEETIKVSGMEVPDMIEVLERVCAIKISASQAVTLQYILWAKIRDRIEQELAGPTMQCSDCGSTGPFCNRLGSGSPEELDIECQMCGSLNVAEGPHEAFQAAEERWERKAKDEYKRGLTTAAGFCRNAQVDDDWTVADMLRERIELERDTPTTPP